MTALLPVLLCGGGMLMCFLLMNRMHNKDHGHAESTDSASTDEVAALREELARLRADVRDSDARDSASSPGPNGQPG